MKAVFIGCVESSHVLLDHMLSGDLIEVTGVVTRTASPFNADFHSLQPLAEAHNIDCLALDGPDADAMAAWITERAPDVVFCIGWSYLLDQRILDIPAHGVIGFHPAPLPVGRGRHPLIWALVYGLTETASCFFLMDEGADSGDIVTQVSITISDADDVASLYAKVLSVAPEQISDICAALNAGNLSAEPQDHARAITWRKRGRDDGRIDFKMTAPAIHNLVCALTKPYVGAHCEVAGEDIKVWKVDVGPDAPPNIKPGKVFSIDGNSITVKCAGGSIILVEHAFPVLPGIGDTL